MKSKQSLKAMVYHSVLVKTKQNQITLRTMKKKISLVGIVFIFGLGISSAFAQETIAATGGDATGAGGSSSYTVGQVVYTTVTGSNGSSAQGVQHAYEVFDVVNLDESFAVHLEISAFPNPTVDILTISIQGDMTQDLSFQLIDNLGRLITTGSLVEKEMQIEMSDLPAGNYFFNISSITGIIKTVKIIKAS